MGIELKFSLVAGHGFKKGSLSFDTACGYFVLIFLGYSYLLNFLRITGITGSGRKDGYCEHRCNRGRSIRMPKEKFPSILTLRQCN
jgi:hypothetical protein